MPGISVKSTHDMSLVISLLIWGPNLRLQRERTENRLYITMPNTILISYKLSTNVISYVWINTEYPVKNSNKLPYGKIVFSWGTMVSFPEFRANSIKRIQLFTPLA